MASTHDNFTCVRSMSWTRVICLRCRLMQSTSAVASSCRLKLSPRAVDCRCRLKLPTDAIAYFYRLIPPTYAIDSCDPLVFSFTPQYACVSVLVSVCAMLVATATYSSLSWGAYATFGVGVEGDLLEAYPRTGLLTIARICVSMLVTSCYPLQVRWSAAIELLRYMGCC